MCQRIVLMQDLKQQHVTEHATRQEQNMFFTVHGWQTICLQVYAAHQKCCCVMQSAVDRASDPNRAAMPMAAELAKEKIAQEMENARPKTDL